MEKEFIINQMKIFYMKVIILMIIKKEMENIFMKKVIIIQDNLKMVYFMEKNLLLFKWK